MYTVAKLEVSESKLNFYCLVGKRKGFAFFFPYQTRSNSHKPDLCLRVYNSKSLPRLLRKKLQRCHDLFYVD